MVPSKSLALIAIAVLALNSLLQLNTDPYLQRQQQQQQQYTEDNESNNLRASSGDYELEQEQALPGETREQLTLRILNRRDKERRMEDTNLPYTNNQNQQIISSSGMNEPSYICNRPADLGAPAQHATTCPGSTTDSNKLILLDGTDTYGRTGNNLMEFLHALQYSRDNDIQLGVKYGSWAMRLLPRMWLSVTGDQSQWEEQFEKALCIKIIHKTVELREYD
eukprot:scaffold21246_cov83-Skeletonema_marinoi.AAC.1